MISQCFGRQMTPCAASSHAHLIVRHNARVGLQLGKQHRAVIREDEIGEPFSRATAIVRVVAPITEVALQPLMTSLWNSDSLCITCYPCQRFPAGQSPAIL